MIPYSMNPLGINKKLTDLDILRQIRDANPTSSLPGFWLDSEDPYTQWEGVSWNPEKTKVTQLSIFDMNIKELPNVNRLTSLQSLRCYFNQLTSLNVAGLASLQFLHCAANQLASLDITGLINLTTLYCNSNQLTSLDITGLSNLTELSCDSNQLISLDVTELTNLTKLYCGSTQLTSLDVAGLTNLTTLNCSFNQLTSLDVTGLTNLTTLVCNFNQLTAIPTLITKGLINNYSFSNNNFSTVELDRFRALGFTNESQLLPQNP